LIELFERGLVRVRAHFSEANLSELARKSSVLLSLCTHDVGIFESGAAVEANTL
jgi:hypothetical protein